ncbi:MAG: pyrroline-5-carboxylate reductase [Prochlorothrix sp.]
MAPRAAIPQFGFIGGGVMAEAILSRFVASGSCVPADLWVSDPLEQRRNWLHQQYGVTAVADNAAVAQAAVLVLAIKPQVLDQVVPTLALHSSATPLVLSILAGVPLQRLETAFPQCPVIRVMPNTPATVGAGISAMAAGSQVQAQHVAQARQLLEAIGTVVEVPERLMDAVTGLSGSGPAYVALMVEALTDGGVAMGLPRSIAQQLALQTVRGTAELMVEQDLHPALLKDRVTSPGGTTIAGIGALERSGFRSALMDAVKAATQRSQELGQG